MGMNKKTPICWIEQQVAQLLNQCKRIENYRGDSFVWQKEGNDTFLFTLRVFFVFSMR